MPACPALPTIMRQNDAHALAIARRIVANLNSAQARRHRLAEPVEPRYDPAELEAWCRRTCKKQYDIREVIARLVDGSDFDEFKALYGTTLVTGFAPPLGHAGRHHRQ